MVGKGLDAFPLTKLYPLAGLMLHAYELIGLKLESYVATWAGFDEEKERLCGPQ